MLTLYTNIENKVAMTLTEKATQVNQDWLIEFVNDLSGQKTYFTPTDISPNTTRYNLFEIQGEGLTGFSKYNVYEMPLMSPKSTDITLAYGICESGKVLIIDPTENEVTQFTEDEEKNNAVFNE